MKNTRSLPPLPSQQHADANASPSAFERRILLAVTGMSPQIVTETLYALAVQRTPSFVPTEVHVLTTSEGAQRVRLELLDEKNGHFHRLLQEYGLPKMRFDADTIHLIRDAEGAPLSDIRDDADNRSAADAIASLMRELSNDPSCAIHASIAGGRKSMGFFLGYAVSLYARAQDRLSHVLVSAPFESLPQFFFPPRQGAVLYTRDNKPVHTGEACIDLAEIPFVRLRGTLPPEMLRVTPHAPGFSQAVAAAQDSQPELRIDLARRTVVCGGRAVRLPPARLAAYAWFALRRLGQGGARQDAGTFSATLRELDLPPSRQLLIDTYVAVVGREGSASDRTLALLEGPDGGITAEWLQENVSRVNKYLRTALGPGMTYTYGIANTGKRGSASYGIALPPGAIHVDGVR